MFAGLLAICITSSDCYCLPQAKRDVQRFSIFAKRQLYQQAASHVCNLLLLSLHLGYSEFFSLASMLHLILSCDQLTEVPAWRWHGICRGLEGIAPSTMFRSAVSSSRSGSRLGRATDLEVEYETVPNLEPDLAEEIILVAIPPPEHSPAPTDTVPTPRRHLALPTIRATPISGVGTTFDAP